MSYFKDWFFNKLPNYYHANDSFKDEDGKGLLQRYLENIGEDIDDNIVPFIDNLLDILDPTKQANNNYKFLNHLAYTVGSPPDIFLGDPAQAAKYAKLLSHIVSIYKIKGTKKSFVSFFALLGYTVNVIEWVPANPDIFDGLDTFEDALFDQGGCQDCSEFSILNQAILNNGPCGQTGNPVLDASLYSLMVEMVEFLQPYATTLRSIITAGLVCEEVDYCYQEQVTFNLYVYDGLLDLPTYIMDTADTWDQRTLQSSSVVNVTC